MTRPTRWRAHALAILILLLLPFVFFWQMTVENAEPVSADTQAARSLGAWAQQTTAHTGKTPLWCPMILSGMPSYGSFIYTPASPFDLTGHVRRLFAESRGMRYYVSLAIGALAMYGLLILRRKPPLAAAAGTLIFVMTPYFLGVVSAGHSTKLQALYLAPLVMLAFELLYLRRSLATGAALAVATALQLWNNHPQISYYTLLLGGLYFVLRVILDRPAAWRGRGLLIGGAIALVALLLAAGLVMEPYGGVLEYTPHSIRGGTGELTSEGAQSGSGWKYATDWSYPVRELVAFVFPGWFGLQAPTYWGTLPFTQSTHYVGLLALILAVIGVRRARGRGRWAPVIVAGVILLIGFGRNLPLLFWPMYKFLPMFSRFRVPSMIYSLLPFFVALMASDGLAAVLAGGSDRASEGPARKAAPAGRGARGGARPWWSWRLLPVALLCLWAVLGGAIATSLAVSGAFHRAGEAAATFAAVRADRIAIFRETVLLGLLWTSIAAIVLELRRHGRIGPGFAAGLLAVALAADLIVIDRKFYDPRPPAETGAFLQPDGVVRFLQAEEPPYRIASFARGDFQSDRYAAFGIESVGGFQPAELRIYKDLIETGAIASPQVLSMLNVQYILHEQSLAAQGMPVLTETTDYTGRRVFIHRNPFSLPRAWFVTEARTAPDAKTLLGRVGDSSFDPWKTAWLLEREAGLLPQSLSPGNLVLENPDGTVTRFKADDPEHWILPVHVEGPQPGLLVMSEIYYAPGWEATIRGGGMKDTKLRLLRVNHVLRALLVPPGDHEIEIQAISPGLDRGRRVSHLAGIGVVLMLLAGGAGPFLTRLRARRGDRRAPAAAAP
jgi:hypothetical protein